MNTVITTVGQQLRKRHPDNPALKLWWENYYHGMCVQTQKGPLIENYLMRLLDVMSKARKDCNRIFAVRIDLHFPSGIQTGVIDLQNTFISTFMYDLQLELDKAGTKYAHKFRNVWCREQGSSVNPHFHLLLLLNGDAYNSLGYMDKTPSGDYGYNNLFHRIVRAWSRSISYPQEYMEGLIQVPKKPVINELATWFFRSNDQAASAEVFGAASYLCKAATKPIGQGVHCFDGSRK